MRPEPVLTPDACTGTSGHNNLPVRQYQAIRQRAVYSSDDKRLPPKRIAVVSRSNQQTIIEAPTCIQEDVIAIWRHGRINNVTVNRVLVRVQPHELALLVKPCRGRVPNVGFAVTCAAGDDHAAIICSPNDGGISEVRTLKRMA